MRIISVNHTSDLYGASRCLERVASRFGADGHELIVVTSKTGSLQKALEGSGVRVLVHPWLPVIDRAAVRTLRGKLRLAAALPISVLWMVWIILRFRIELVHTNSAVIV